MMATNGCVECWKDNRTYRPAEGVYKQDPLCAFHLKQFRLQDGDDEPTTPTPQPTITRESTRQESKLMTPKNGQTTEEKHICASSDCPCLNHEFMGKPVNSGGKTYCSRKCAQREYYREHYRAGPSKTNSKNKTPKGGKPKPSPTPISTDTYQEREQITSVKITEKQLDTFWSSRTVHEKGQLFAMFISFE